jgi:hypothetical protein
MGIEKAQRLILGRVDGFNVLYEGIVAIDGDGKCVPASVGGRERVVGRQYGLRIATGEMQGVRVINVHANVRAQNRNREIEWNTRGGRGWSGEDKRVGFGNST